MKTVDMICTYCAYRFTVRMEKAEEQRAYICPKCGSQAAFRWKLVKVWAEECRKMDPPPNPNCIMFPFRNKIMI